MLKQLLAEFKRFCAGSLCGRFRRREGCKRMYLVNKCFIVHFKYCMCINEKQYLEQTQNCTYIGKGKGLFINGLVTLSTPISFKKEQIHFVQRMTEAVEEIAAVEIKSDSVKDLSLVPPIRFCYVNPGLSRGAYPTLRNFRFLSRLQLKTIISITPEPPIPDLVLFAEMAGIKLLHVPISRTSALSEPMQLALLSVVNVSLCQVTTICL